MPVQTINPFIEPYEDETPSIESIIERENKTLDDISSQFRLNAVKDITFGQITNEDGTPDITNTDESPTNPIKSAISSINASSFSRESNIQGLARTSIAYSEQKIRIAILEGEAADEKVGYEKSKAKEQAATNRAGWTLVNSFAKGNRIHEPRSFKGDFKTVRDIGVNIYHPENVVLGEDGGDYLLQETKDIKHIAQKYNLETRLIDEFEPLYILLNPGNDPDTSGVYFENKILLNNVGNLADPEVRMVVSHELTHAFFGLTPILEHTEGLPMLLSFIRHPEASNPNTFASSGLATLLSERFHEIPLSIEDCMTALSSLREIVNIKDFEYVYGFNFAMSFFDYFRDQGVEFALERYMQFYGALRRGIIFSSSVADPSNPNRGEMLVQGHERLPGVKDSDVTIEALLIAGVDPNEFRTSLGNTMRDPNALLKQREISAKLQSTIMQ